VLERCTAPVELSRYCATVTPMPSTTTATRAESAFVDRACGSGSKVERTVLLIPSEYPAFRAQPANCPPIRASGKAHPPPPPRRGRARRHPPRPEPPCLPA
jgi:hypothetical protein